MIADGILTVAAALEAAAGRWPERPLLNTLPETAEVYGVAAGELSYAGAARQVAELAGALAGAGYERGARVMLLLENRPAGGFSAYRIDRVAAVRARSASLPSTRRRPASPNAAGSSSCRRSLRNIPRRLASFSMSSLSIIIPV